MNFIQIVFSAVTKITSVQIRLMVVAIIVDVGLSVLYLRGSTGLEEVRPTEGEEGDQGTIIRTLVVALHITSTLINTTVTHRPTTTTAPSMRASHSCIWGPGNLVQIV